MKSVLDTLNANAGAFNVVFTFVVAAATIVYAILTAKLVRETKRMRQSQTDAEVVIRVQSSETWINLIELVVENVGAGTAYDVKLVAEPDLEYQPGKKLSDLGLFKHGLHLLGPRQSLRTFLMSVADKVTQVEDPEGPFRFTVNVCYRTAAGEKVDRRFWLDLLHLIGMVQLGTPPLVTIARSIESMKNEFDHVLSDFKRIHVVALSNEDVKREESEALARFQERMDKQKSDDAV